jgi:DNA ligase-1
MHRLATTLDAVRATRGKKAKVRLLAELWRTLDDEALAVASRLVLGKVLHATDPRTTGVGWAIASAAAAAVTGHSEQHIGLKSRELGDFGDALAELITHRGALDLREVPALIDALATADDRAVKQRLLEDLLRRTGPAEARYLGKALLGELRIGVAHGLFEESLAVAFTRPLDQVRRAAALTHDPGDLALLARHDRLAQARLVPGRVVAFMLASPTEDVRTPVDPALTVVEDKLDGVRTQAHVTAGTVRLFARGQDEVTDAFPEVAESLRRFTRDVVLDGEILAVTPDGRARPFQALQGRLGRRQVSERKRRETPVQFIAYDCLYDGESIVDRPFSERRARLEKLPLLVNPLRPLDPSRPVDEQLDAEFTAARARGHEGLMLKRVDARYEAGARGSAWRKVKRAFATLDVVITRAERGHGRRAGVLSDYTFAVWQGDALVEIGKAYSGLTDLEIAALTTQLQALTTAQEGPFHVVRPEVVLEIAFDGLQRSTRHESGFALRFPRIVRVRHDKHAADADRLETVTNLWNAQLATGHREQAPARAQLSLFGD